MDLHPLANTCLHPDIRIRNNWVKKIATDVNIPNNENNNRVILNIMTDSKMILIDYSMQRRQNMRK